MKKLQKWLERSMEIIPNIGIILGILFMIQFIIRL